jgi:hypothetical protein
LKREEKGREEKKRKEKSTSREAMGPCQVAH